MMALPEKPMLRIDEVAAFYDVTHRAVYGWISTGLLTAQKVGRAIRIKREDAISFAKEVKRS